jgi:hypothetical protein
MAMATVHGVLAANGIDVNISDWTDFDDFQTSCRPYYQKAMPRFQPEQDAARYPVRAFVWFGERPDGAPRIWLAGSRAVRDTRRSGTPSTRLPAYPSGR